MKHSRAPAALKDLVIATANPGKLREFQALLAGLAVAPVAQGALGVAAPRGDRQHVRRERVAEGAARGGGERRGGNRR